MRAQLGQHFLIKKSAIQTIITALSPSSEDVIIEIGPGRGALTEQLAKEKFKKLILIEKDQRLALDLYTRYEKQNTIQVIHGDALDELEKYLAPGASYKIVGNIPYYITGKLLRIISSLDSKPKKTVLMIQKEVAERIAAQPPAMNLLAAATQFWSNPKILETLKPKDFSPSPKVDSAVIELVSKASSAPNSEAFYRFIHILFKQPRKTIGNNLSIGLTLPKNDLQQRLEALKISPKDRAQNLALEQIQKLVDLFTV